VPRKSIVVLLCVFATRLLVAVAGCGGSSNSSAQETTTEAVLTETTETSDTESTETVDEAMTETTEAMTTDEMTTDEMETSTEAMTTDESMTDTGADTTSTDDGSTSSGGFSLANEDCRELASISASLSQAFSGGGTADWDQYVTFLNELADKAPDEIADDFAVLADAYAKIADALGGMDLSDPNATPTPEQLAALTKLGQELDQAKLTEATTNISTWMSQNCTGG
jgi:hypothetical protein